MKHAAGRDALVLPAPPAEVLDAVAAGSYYNPHEVLGQHLLTLPGVSDPVTVIRALRPLAAQVFAILSTGARVELAHLSAGIWQGYSTLGLMDYTLEATYTNGPAWVSDDPYRYGPTIGELDLHLIGEGRHEQLWDALGAHVREHAGVHSVTAGTSFAVWAPHARAVRVIGDFNRSEERRVGKECPV